MPTDHTMTSPDALTFLLAGKASFTTVNDATGGRFTYRVRKAEEGDRHFVDLLVGTGSYARLGMIFDSKRFGIPRAWTIDKDAPSARAFEWVFKRLVAERDLLTVRFLHEGRCGRCNRALTVPESIEMGLGPVCATK